MKTYEFTARTTEEAISAGLEQLGLSISDVVVDVLEEGSKGLFGLFGSRPAKIRLTVKEDETSSEVHDLFNGMLEEKTKENKPAKDKSEKAEKPAAKTEKKEKAPKAEKQEKEAAPKAEKTEKAEKQEKAEKPARKPKETKKPVDEKPVEKKEIVPAEQADRATPAGKAQEFLQELTKLMNVPVSVAVSTDEEGNVHVNMEGDTLGILIGRRGETLDALQYLTSLQVNKGKNDYTRVTLDTENYRAKREEALIRLANRMANRCQKTGRKVSMEPMNPYERRILHSALQDHPAVTTHSEGDEPNRHVVITLKKESKKEQ
ncbi:MAG: Jag N-terminal domain-containing protein [Clostridia bacterium]|nr:Jag N-terminal domain-containing protein [Clostridia bacterium]